MIGTSGSFEFGSLSPRTGEFTGRIAWYDDYSANNTSKPAIESLQFKSPSWGTGFYVNGTISVDGVTVITFDEFAGTHQVTIVKNGGFAPVIPTDSKYPAAPWVGSPVTHANDGSKTVTIAADLKIRSFGGGIIANFKASKAVTLTNIPRASTVGAADGNIEAVATISVNRRSEAYTHTLQYTFGSVSGYINADGQAVESPAQMTAASIPFRVPTTFYSQIPNSQNGVCTITCRTYSGGTQIGDAQRATFTAYCNPALCAPAVSGTVAVMDGESIALTGSSRKIIKFISTVQADNTATSKNSATIASRSINGINGEKLVISNCEQTTFQFIAVDSRGFSDETSEELPVVPYIKLTSHSEYIRPDSTGSTVRLIVTGDYFGGSFGAQSNALNLAYSLDGNSQRIAITNINISDGKYTGIAEIEGLGYAETHSLEVYASDKLMSVNKRLEIGGGVPHWAMGPTYFATRQLLRPEGSIADLNIYVNKAIDPNTQDFTVFLEEAYSKMPNNSVRVIQFTDYPAGQGAASSGFLLKTNDNYGALIGWSYAGNQMFKAKLGGVWQEWILKSI